MCAQFCALDMVLDFTVCTSRTTLNLSQWHALMAPAVTCFAPKISLVSMNLKDELTVT